MNFCLISVKKNGRVTPYKNTRCYTMAKTRLSRVPVDDL